MLQVGDVFLVCDLCPEHLQDTRTITIGHERYGFLTVNLSNAHYGTVLPTFHSLRKWLRSTLPDLSGNKPYAPPTIDAEKLAQAIRRRRPLTAGDLLLDPEFVRSARRAVQQKRTFTHELSAWEKRDVVIEAVRVVAEQVRVEQEESRRRREQKEEEERRRIEREKPTVDAVLAAYALCNYRRCAQGHKTLVHLLPERYARSEPEVDCNVLLGDSYSSACTWRKKYSCHSLTVRPDWLKCFPVESMQTYRNELVLSADICGHTATRPVYSLLLVKQSKGTQLTTHRRFALLQDSRWKKPPRFTAYLDFGVARDACLDKGIIHD